MTEAALVCPDIFQQSARAAAATGACGRGWQAPVARLG